MIIFEAYELIHKVRMFLLIYLFGAFADRFMKIIPTEFSDLYLIELQHLEDERGFFARTFCRDTFIKSGLIPTMQQCSLSFNKKLGTLRGMHYQVEPFEEVKLVRCTRGKIYDVVIDLRPNSDTYKKWKAFELTSEKMLYIPVGFAHGFQTLEDNTEVFYQISEKFSPEHARGIRFDDKSFSIKWPLAISVISQKDQNYADYNSYSS